MPVSGLREPLHHAGGPQHGERACVQPGARAPPPLPAATTHGALPPACGHGGAGDSGGPEWLVDDALSPSRAFLEYYQEHLEYACPTEDIYLE